MTAAYVVGYDAIRVNAAFMPRDAQIYAGYATGSGDVPWTEELFSQYATALGPCLRIDQDPSASDATADYLDVEQGAATVADCSWWAKKALADFGAWKRPGQRSPAIYCSGSNVTPVVNNLVSGGIASGVGLIVANWSLSEEQAVADVLGAKGPFPVVGVQFSDPGSFDVDIYSRAWLLNQAGKPKPAPAPSPAPVNAWQEAMMNALPNLQNGSQDRPGEVQFVHRAQALTSCIGAINGFGAVTALKQDGDYGAATEAGVKRIQEFFGLVPSGAVDSATWTHLVAGLAPRVALAPSTLPLTAGAPAEASAIPDPGPWHHDGSRPSNRNPPTSPEGDPLAWKPGGDHEFREVVTRQLTEIEQQITTILKGMETLLSAQSDVTAAAAAINAAVTTLGTVTTDLTSATANITAEIAALQAANPTVDTSALNTAVAALAAPLAALQAADTAVDALETPAAPAPPA